MRTRRIAAAMTAVSVAFMILIPREVAAQSRELRVLASDGVKAVMEELRPQCERAVGLPIRMEFNTSAALLQKIEAGEAFDVAILTTGLIGGLTQEGKIASGTRSDLARVGIGVGIRDGAPKPDISTAAALKRVLLNAKSVTYAHDGASRAYIEETYQRLGIVEDMKGKIILQDVPGRPQTFVAEGKAELVMTLVSEILPVPGIVLLGPLPAELQHYVAFAGGVGAHAPHAEAGQALLRFLSGPAAAPAFRAKGMEAR
jgi:molybdate transport system substrate-binding protein